MTLEMMHVGSTFESHLAPSQGGVFYFLKVVIFSQLKLGSRQGH